MMHQSKGIAKTKNIPYQVFRYLNFFQRKAF